MLCPSLSDIAIITVRSGDYLGIIHGISKSDTSHLLKNFVLDDRGYMQNAYQKYQNSFYKYYFDNLIKKKKIKTKNVLIDAKTHKDLVI